MIIETQDPGNFFFSLWVLGDRVDAAEVANEINYGYTEFKMS